MKNENRGFNSMAFDLLKKFGLIIEITSTARGHIVLEFNLPSGHKLGLAGPSAMFRSDAFSSATQHVTDVDRMEFFQSDESCYAAARAGKAWAIQQKALADASSNNKFSGNGKAEIAIQTTSTAIVAVATQYASLISIAATLDRRRSELFAVPVASAADAAADVYHWRRFDAMTDGEKIQLIASMDRDNAAPGLERVLVALRRNPWPHPNQVAELIEGAWTKRVALVNQEAVADYQIASDNLEFAQRFVKFIATQLLNASLNGTHGALSNYDYYRLVKDTGGVDVLGIEPNMLRSYERRVLEAAA